MMRKTPSELRAEVGLSAPAEARSGITDVAVAESLANGSTGSQARRLPSERVLRRLALASILLLGGVLRFWNLASLGLANHYYTAAIVGMLQSWHNFFFVSAEPGGSVSVDKPPVGFWLQALSSWVFGVNGFGVLLPEILAGLASVVLVYHLVRRSFGTVAGLLAGLALAVTPIFVATNRNNTIDSTLIFVLLLATWAFVKATERGGLRYLLLGAALVGVGFNVKMLEAYLPLPALYGLYVLGGRDSLRRKVPNVLLSLVVLVGVSFSWAVAVDLTPASDRPFVGSSGDNSVMSLALGYNGVQRLLGRNGRGGLLSDVLGGTQSVGQGSGQRDGGQPGGNQALVPPAGFQGAPGADGQRDGGMPGQPGGFQGRGAAGGGPGGPGGGFPGTGQAGPLRLFVTPLSKEVSWLLPFGLLSLALLGVGSRVRWPLGDKHRAIVLWGGWLVTGGVFFSVAGFFHEYYLSTIAAPLAALFGIGAVEIWRTRNNHRWLSFAVLCLAAAATLGFQILTARAYVGDAPWLAVGAVTLAIGVALLALPASRRLGWTARAGFAVAVAALLVVPTVWSALGTVNSGGNASMPSAYSGRSGGGMPGGMFGGMGGDTGGVGLRVDQALINYLQANTQGMKYLMAVPSSMQGSDYVLATGRPVLFLGGFGGRDKVASVDDLKAMVAAGELRYFELGGNGADRGGPGAGQSDVTTWVTGTCNVVPGVGNASAGSGGRNAGGSLYDCGAPK